MLGVILVIVWIAVVVHLLKKGEEIVCFNNSQIPWGALFEDTREERLPISQILNSEVKM